MGERARVALADYRAHPDACSPNCGECVPCLKERLSAACMWRDRFQWELSAASSELIGLRGRIREIAAELDGAA